MAELPIFDEVRQAIYPIDPQGQGTWIATNQNGETWCLLNLYQKNQAAELGYSATSARKQKLLSRGQIILACLSAQTDMSLPRLQDYCGKYKFSPFTLCYFPKVLTPQNWQPIYWQWDGIQVTAQQLPNMFTSSGKAFTKVLSHRQAVFSQFSRQQSNDYLWQFHTSHQPSKSHTSVCMHRADAKSVSITEVTSSTTVQQMKYWNTSPCQAQYSKPTARLIINR
ncbi:hypothetical protein DS2_01763 [Catenovulum agarivorans DS-2]|uniref:Uncharacterized protein n=1 Tax=Catenovulum agarivorans DS-2 TaxID=1328313 RepID=W7QS82_9ALTE|nr:hypothetical protein DS2_01763 [Catenovulum agarivorans DS-2]